MCDPEHVGFGMRRMLPAGLRGNFQDLPAWRHSVVELLRLTLAAWDGPVIVPMTLVNSGYFQEIVGRLRDDGLAVHHITLLAEPATVRRRLGRRSLGLERKQGSSAGLAIAPSTDGPLRAALRQYATTIRHVRFD